MNDLEPPTYAVYVETGNKRTFSGVIAWPGWCRSGRDEPAALRALLDYAPRYAAVLRQADLHLPVAVASFTVTERLEGNRTTDFGAPAMMPEADNQPLTDADLHRFQALLPACWQAFDSARTHAGGRKLRQGPRGGGRDLPAIVHHVLEADLAYLGRVGRKPALDPDLEPEEALSQVRQSILETVIVGARGELPTRGPRGGIRWPVRYFVRRVAWHVLDHAWELEDRILA